MLLSVPKERSTLGGVRQQGWKYFNLGFGSSKFNTSETYHDIVLAYLNTLIPPTRRQLFLL